MPTGIRTKDSSGNTTSDTSTVAALFADEFTVTGSPGTITTRTYPAFAGMSMIYSVSPTRNDYAFGQSSSDFVAYIDVDYALGYPRLTIRAGVETTVVYAFVR